VRRRTAPAVGAADRGVVPAAPLTARDLQEPLLSIADVAERCGVVEKTVWRWIKGGRLAARKLGGQWRVHPSDYRRFLRSGLARA
jgi:excisionase family DNA binding protein